MVHCDYSAIVSPISHCKAAAFCNAAEGWHVCTASEFLARGGATLPPLGNAAWIAACVRDKGTIHSASTAPAKCSVCDNTPAGTVPMIWDCNGTYQNQVVAYANVAVHSYGMCTRLGTNVSQNNGRWIAKWVDDPSVHGVLCCWP